VRIEEVPSLAWITRKLTIETIAAPTRKETRYGTVIAASAALRSVVPARALA
jgi:hypothetical protein